MDWLGKIFEFLKLPIKFIAFFAFTAGLLMIMPDEIINKLKLKDFITSYGSHLGLVFIISTVFLIFTLIPLSFKYIKNKVSDHFANKRFLENIQSTLSGLTYPEKCLLREFIIQQKDVIEAHYECPEVVSLINKGIIQYASKQVRSFIFGNFVFIQRNPHAKEYFNHDTYGLPNRELTQSDRQKFKNERPDYLTNLNYINGLMSGKF